MLQLLILMMLFVQQSSAFNVKRGSGGSNILTDCKKDILVLWDNSNSIGIQGFLNVSAFIQGLIKNENLNVKKDGTHLGFITFSNRTETLLTVGNKTSRDDLIDWTNMLNYSRDLMGDRTLTGDAFKVAEAIFSKKSPWNARPDVEDVILLITDGSPNPSNQVNITDNSSKNLKNRGIKIVGLAVGIPNQVQEFKHQIENWASNSSAPKSKLVFESKLEYMEDVVDKLIPPLCKKEPACCHCKGEFEGTSIVYVEAGTNTTLKWPVDLAQCDHSDCQIKDRGPPKDKFNKTYNKRNKFFEGIFGEGEHHLAHRYSYTERNGESRDLQCSVSFNITHCKCSDVKTVVPKKLSFANGTALVEWEIPYPICSNDDGRKSTNKTSKILHAGEHKINYTYDMTNGPFEHKFNLVCPVKIFVPGQYCGDITYDPSTHVCCCGAAFKKKREKICCGQKYINATKTTCCPGGKPVKFPWTCPN